MSQSKKASAAESLVNVLVGYGVAVAAQMVIFPAFGIHIAPADNFAIAAFFTIVSLARSYLLRRAFNALRKKE